MSPPGDNAPLSPVRIGLAVAVVLVLHVGIALWAAAKESVTADEILYVTGGYYIDRFGDYRIQPENGVLPQRLHGLAAIWTGATHPPLEHNEYWRTSSNLVNSYQFFYETGHDHFPMLMLARGLNLLFSVGTGLLVFLWARRLAGPTAGLVALALFAADPNVLAHGALATSDLAAVFLLLASLSAFGWTLLAPSPARAALSAVIFGLACVAKYSAVLLPPVFVVLLAGQAWRRRDIRWGAVAPLLVAAHIAGAFAVIWLCHGFRFSGFSPELPPAAHYATSWENVLPYVGVQGPLIEWFRDARLLPESFLYGYGWMLQSARARAAFLAGEYGNFGWVGFFPLAFAWKTTLALLAGLVLGAVALGRRWLADRTRPAADVLALAPLLLFGALYLAVSLTSKLNIGHRHILPLYPLLYIAVGAWAASLAGPRLWRIGLPVALLVAQVAASASVAPHFVAYFNRLAGGPANGYRLLVDSSLDWGQDLPALRDWLARHNAGPDRAPVFLSYFGSGEPAYYGIAATRLPFVNGFKLPRLWYEPGPGLYCVSATMLQQVYSGFGGNWTAELEGEYRRLRTLEPAFKEFLAGGGGAFPEGTTEAQWRANWRRYDDLRFARLCAALRSREPDANAGYSILIYRVSAEELAAALGPSPGR
jgi:hypothetical protein